MLKKLILVFVAVMLFGFVGKAQSFNVTGVWNHHFGGTAQFFQSGNKVEFVYINAKYAHYGSYTYTSKSTYEGTLKRVNRTNGCTTFLKIVGEVASNNSIKENWQGKDSDCDLTKNFTYTLTLKSRVN